MKHASKDKTFERKVFESLYGSLDLDEGVNNALALIGQEFGISRAYIFENSEDNKYGNNTYEWCAEGIVPQIEQLQNLSYEEYGYDRLFTETGEFFCSDTSQLSQIQRELFESQSIFATIQFAMFDKTRFCGFVGFDDCTRIRPDWEDGGDEFDGLIFLSQLLSVYLIKERNLRNAEQYQKKMQLALDAAEKANRAKADFYSRMSHDMRTPMNGIIGMTRLTQEMDGLSAEVRENLSAIADSSLYLLQLINDTLDMNKIEGKKFTLKEEIVDTGEFIRNIISTVRSMVEKKNIKLKFVPLNTEFGYIKADKMRLRQIFLNILSNAVKFTPVSGEIKMMIECLSAENSVANTRICISDNGCGMSEEFLGRIFEPFTQENTKIVAGQEGTGLGMAIVKNLVELMGGRIEISSNLGVGTDVNVYLSFERVYNYKGEKADKENNEFSFLSGKRILIAEDHPLNATIATRILEKKGVIVELADDGMVAVEMFSDSENGYYDAILMDIRMPGMNGFEATKSIRNLDREDAARIPIIAMTANAYPEDIEAAINAGMTAHLSKPIEPELMYSEISRQLQKQTL